MQIIKQDAFHSAISGLHSLKRCNDVTMYGFIDVMMY